MKNVALTNSNIELDTLLHSISHDLRSPITSMKGLIELISTETDPEEVKNYLALMDTVVDKQNIFINDFINEEYRKNILNLCLLYENVFPIFFVEMRGLSKMWNTLLIHSTKDDLLILNDDINVTSNNMFEVVSNHIKTP